MEYNTIITNSINMAIILIIMAIIYYTLYYFFSNELNRLIDGIEQFLNNIYSWIRRYFGV